MPFGRNLVSKASQIETTCGTASECCSHGSPEPRFWPPEPRFRINTPEQRFRRNTPQSSRGGPHAQSRARPVPIRALPLVLWCCVSNPHLRSSYPKLQWGDTVATRAPQDLHTPRRARLGSVPRRARPRLGAHIDVFLSSRRPFGYPRATQLFQRCNAEDFVAFWTALSRGFSPRDSRPEGYL